ncbi:hypothetical protein [Arthrobacter sp. PAMC25564]|uniref:hypothetical protein n=1 Tax=Arthrobacter sp. PAMC25564 TaxID=2565366 RepID=UPI001F116CC0|nr:hypothetical protein [Arthrobacter sp. PAMC25564]
MSQEPDDPAEPTRGGAPDVPPPGAGRDRPDRVLFGIVAAIAVLVVVALGVVFLRGEPQLLDESTPAGVVQRYSKAVIDSDTAAADAYLTDNARSRCANYYGGAQASRVVLISTTERGGTATVKVSIVHSAEAGPFGPSEYAEEGVLGLVKAGGKWMINELPYSLQTCAGGMLKK